MRDRWKEEFLLQTRRIKLFSILLGAPSIQELLHMCFLGWLLKLRPFLLSGRHLHGDVQFLIVAAGGGHFLKRTGEEAAGGADLVLRSPGVGDEITTNLSVFVFVNFSS